MSRKWLPVGLLLMVLILVYMLNASGFGQGNEASPTAVITALITPEPVAAATFTPTIPPFTATSSTPTRTIRPSATPRPATYDGQATLYLNLDNPYGTASFGDLDLPFSCGVYGPDHVFHSDIHWQRSVEEPSRSVLRAVNRAKVYFTATEPTAAACREALETVSPNNTITLDKQGYLCVLTTEGIITRVQMPHWESDMADTTLLHLEYTRSFADFRYGQPTPTATRSPLEAPIGPAGTVLMKVNSAFNADNPTGIWTLAGEDDLTLISQKEVLQLQAVNGAQLWPLNANDSSFDACQQKQSITSPQPFVVPISGSHFCLLTNQGHLAHVQIETIHPDYPDLLKINYTTWQQIVAYYPPTPTPIIDTVHPLRTVGAVQIGVAMPLLAEPGRLNTFPNHPDSLLDMDTGLVAFKEEADVAYVGDHGQGCMAMYITRLSPSGSSEVHAMGSEMPNFATCQRVIHREESYDALIPETGNYYCVLTNQGRLGYFHVDWVDNRRLRANESFLQLSFVTWDEIVVAPEGE